MIFTTFLERDSDKNKVSQNPKASQQLCRWTSEMNVLRAASLSLVLPPLEWKDIKDKWGSKHASKGAKLAFINVTSYPFL